MRVWEPLDGGKGGNLGTAIVLPAGAKLEEHHGDLEYLIVTPVPKDGRLVYYAGSAWDRAGRIKDQAAWAAEVQGLARRLAESRQGQADRRQVGWPQRQQERARISTKMLVGGRPGAAQIAKIRLEV